MKLLKKIVVFLLVMNLYRNPYCKHVVIFLTGIAFLNMSFFMAEVSVLKLSPKHNKQMIENIAKLISNSGFEEESDASEETTEGDVNFKEIDLLSHFLSTHHESLFLLAQRRNATLQKSIIDPEYLEILSPPPEA